MLHSCVSYFFFVYLPFSYSYIVTEIVTNNLSCSYEGRLSLSHSHLCINRSANSDTRHVTGACYCSCFRLLSVSSAVRLKDKHWSGPSVDWVGLGHKFQSSSGLVLVQITNLIFSVNLC